MNTLPAVSASYAAYVEPVETFLGAEKPLPAQRVPAGEGSELVVHQNAVMIVEDVESIAKLYGILLKRAGFDPFIFSNGEDACVWMKNNCPAAVVCDIMLPGMNGHDVLAYIRSTGHGADLPVIAVSALATKGERERFLDAGFDDYLAKPIGASSFTETVRRSIAETVSRKVFES